MNNAATRIAGSPRSVEPWLLDAAVDALGLADASGSSLLRVHGPLEGGDPLRLLGLDEEAFAVDDPWSGLVFAGLGAEGGAAVEETIAWSSRQRELVVERAAPGAAVAPVPVLCAALPFDREGVAGGPWARWPGAVTRVPSVVVWQDEGGGGVVVQVRVTRGEDPDRLAGVVAARLAEVARRAARGAAVRAVWTRASGAACQGLMARPSETRDAWCARVERGLSAIAAGELRKVVPARSVRFLPPKGHRFDWPATLAALRVRNPGALCFAVAGPWGCFLGASPELLLRVDGDRVESRPLAGTAPRGADPERDAELARALLASAKDRREHRLVVEGIRAALAPACRDVDAPEGPHVARLPTLLHLETPIRARLVAGGPLELLGRLHPTPAIGGAPSEAAVAWLRREEPVARGLYGGPVGWVGPGVATFALGIRSALVTPDEVVAWAGAGIVRGSDPEAEWRETHLKLAVVREALAVRRSR